MDSCQLKKTFKNVGFYARKVGLEVIHQKIYFLHITGHLTTVTALQPRA